MVPGINVIGGMLLGEYDCFHFFKLKSPWLALAPYKYFYDILVKKHSPEQYP